MVMGVPISNNERPNDGPAEWSKTTLEHCKRINERLRLNSVGVRIDQLNDRTELMNRATSNGR